METEEEINREMIAENMLDDSQETDSHLSLDMADVPLCRSSSVESLSTESSSCFSRPQSPTDLDKSCLMLATTDNDWQAQCVSVRERNKAMYNNTLMSDIAFMVGNETAKEKFAAHKYILCTGSSVFYTMFHGSLPCQDPEIEIPDVEPRAFENLLRYLYYDHYEPEADSVLTTLYVAKKYHVPNLARRCVNYLETSLTARNACILLSQSRLFDETDLTSRCWQVIDAQAEEAMKAEGFADIDYETLQLILGRETLNCREISLFDAALRWAARECESRELEATPENQRLVLGSALHKLRLPTMALKEYADGPAQCGVLTLEESNDLFLYFTSSNFKKQLPFPSHQRKGLHPMFCHRFLSSAYRCNQWRYRGRCDSIQFSVDKRVFIAGYGLFGSSNAAANYKVKMELKRNGTVLSSNETTFYSDGSSKTFPVYFAHPFQIEPDTFYTASVILEGGQLSYFGQEGMAEVMENKVTFQFQCSSDSTNGTGVQGGQIPEIIYYC